MAHFFQTRSRWLIPALVLLALPAIAAPKKATLKLKVKPADVSIYVDDKLVGQAGAEKDLPMVPGTHKVKLVRKQVSHEETVTLKAGETKTWAFEFAADDGKDEVKLEDSPSPAE